MVRMRAFGAAGAAFMAAAAGLAAAAPAMAADGPSGGDAEVTVSSERAGARMRAYMLLPADGTPPAAAVEAVSEAAGRDASGRDGMAAAVASMAGGGVAEAAARSLAASDAPFEPMSAGVAARLPAGTWLIASASADGTLEAAPIVVTVPAGGSVMLAEKAALPTARKEADAGLGWSANVESPLMTPIRFRVRGTAPADVADGGTCRYSFSDEPSPALEVDEGSVEVLVAGRTVDPSLYSVSMDGGRLSVELADLASVSGVRGGCDVTLEYDARLVPSRGVVLGSAGNPNDAWVTWSRDGGGSGETGRTRAVARSLGLRVLKSGEGDVPLAGAGFTVRAEDGRYLQPDGSLGDEPAVMRTDDDGTLLAAGLTSGTYEVREAEAPAGYAAVRPFAVTVESVAGPSGAMEGLRADVRSEAGVSLASADASSGVVTVRVVDPREGGIGQTGDAGVWAAAGAIAAAAGVAIAVAARRRR